MLNKKFSVVAIAISITVIIGSFIIYTYLYQDHRDVDNEPIDFSISSTNLTKEFLENSNVAEQKYLNRVVNVIGPITELNTDNITLGHQIFCQFKAPINHKATPLQSIGNVKGRVIGYDDLLELIKIDQCSFIVNQTQ